MKTIAMLGVAAAALTIAGCASNETNAKPPAPAAVSSTAAVPPSPATAYSTTSTPLGQLLDNPKTREIIDRDIPGLSSKEQIDLAREMPLKTVQMYAPATITDESLEKVDADFAKLNSQNK